MDMNCDSKVDEVGIDSYAQRICTSCGLCCDGSLFRRARVFPVEDASLFKSLGLRLISIKEGCQRFSLPCHHLQGAVCSIYDKTRPQICSEFRCNLLKRFYADEISFDDAMKTVRNAVEHVLQVRTDLTMEITLDSSCLADLFFEWRKSFGSECSAIDLNYHALQFRLNRDFRLKNNE